MKSLFALSTLTATLSLFSMACGPDERVDPAPTATTTTDPGEGGAPPVPTTPREKVREVYLRNPLGGPIDNLLVDGDFELSIVRDFEAGGQYGWGAFDASGNVVVLHAETGGLCRTGLHCAVVPAKSVVLGRGASAPNGAANHASIFVKSRDPAKTDCQFGNFYMLFSDSFAVGKKLKASDAPDAEGYCEYSADIDPTSAGLWMYIELGSTPVLLDSATLLAVPVAQPHPNAKPVDLGDPALTARLETLRERVRRRMPFGLPASEPPKD
ncbi:MAG: hypothetical protein U0271_01615 [Polyangiaceae bacterium]